VAPEHYEGAFHYINLTHATYWAIELQALKLGNFLEITYTPHAIVDSGTSLLVGPTREVEALAAMMGAISIQGLYAVDCSVPIPPLTFRLGDRDWQLERSDLIVEEEQGVCILGLQSIDTVMPMWILGNIFMRKYYTVFDYGAKRLGFALASQAGTSSNLV